MTCQVNHEQMTTKYCTECGAVRVEQPKPVDETIAQQLNEIVNEVIAETIKNGMYENGYQDKGTFYRKNQYQNCLFLEKIMKRKIEIPDGALFVITANPPHKIFTLNEVYLKYPFLKEVDINSLIKVEPNSKNTIDTTTIAHFARMHSFLIAHGNCEKDEYYSPVFDTILKTLDEKDFKDSGLSLSDLLDGSLAAATKRLMSACYCDKKYIKYILNKLSKEFA